MRNDLLKRFFLVPVIALLFTGELYAQFEEGQRDPALVGVIAGNQAMPATNLVTISPTQGESSKKIQNIIRFKLNELALTTPSGPRAYFKAGFTATVTLSVGVWTLASNNSPTPDQTFTPATPLVVTYDPTAGNPYNPMAYWVVSGVAGYEKVQVSVTSITVSNLSNGSWTSGNVLPLLTVENEMRVLRYFSGPALLAPTVNPVYDATNHPDQLSVSWSFPSGANSSQLEYAWVENETQGFYFVNGSLNSNLLFRTNSTRVDIDTSGQTFNIPLLYDADPAKGGGTLYYRVRSVQKKNNGNVIKGAWSSPQTFSYSGHQPSLNWQSSTSFAENGKTKSVIRYYDGSLRARQTVTKDNSTGNTMVAETIYDLQGRPNVQILPTPTLSMAIKYYADFNRFQGQTTHDDPAKYFDLTVVGNQCNGAPKLDTLRGNGQYYSHNNPWIGVENMAGYIPGANGYAYTETRYSNDPTQRVSSQGGVGQAHQIGNGHETSYFYGKPAQNELDALFGTEAGDASHYFKNMVQDANGQMSISYADMHGRTVATSLAGSNPPNLSNINNNASFYPVSGLLTNNLLTPVNNIIKGDSIQSISTLLVPVPTLYNFTYQLNPAILQQLSVNSQQICFDCKYNLEISFRQEGCSNVAPIVKDYNNLQIVAANQACNTPMGFVGDVISTPTNQITIPITLGPGSWVVRKTLSINDSAFKVRRDSALKVFLSRTQQNLSDSVFTTMSAATSCATPATLRNCTACQALLGSSYSSSSYKTNYLASVGSTTSLTDADIHALYTQDSLGCAEACGTTQNPYFGTLAGIRSLMLADMAPYTGQYAIPASQISSNSLLQAKYNIFTTSYTGTFGTFGTKPFYRNPVAEPNGAASFYSPGDGTVDNTIYPNGVAPLTNIPADSFTNLFNRSWAAQLIYYHPEYGKLHFAETTLSSSYAWLDKVLQCDSYSLASSNGYLAPLTSDPYFTNNYVPGDQTSMSRYLTQYIGNPPNGVPASNNIQISLWQIANGTVLCDSTQPSQVRESCMLSLRNTGLDPSAVTTAQQDAVWQAFRALYTGYRNEMVLGYINAQQASSLSAAAMTELTINEGKQLRFANAATAAGQNGWTWWSTATSPTVDSANLTSVANSYAAANTIDKCIAQRPFWQARLSQCEVLQQYLANQTPADSATVNTIINAILDSMVMVCHNSIDGNNTSGASNVNPAKLPVVPANFENIVNHVFTQYQIPLPPNNYFCNPYSIDYPKPYNSNPPLFVNYKGSVDSCNCRQIGLLKTSAKAAGYDTTSFSSMNSFLLKNYKDTLTLPLWQGLQQCNGHSWTQVFCYGQGGAAFAVGGGAKAAAVQPLVSGGPCVNVYNPIPLSAAVAVPSFLNCGYVRPCVTCTLLQSYTNAFRTQYPACAGVPYTSGGSSTDTAMAKQNSLWARYLNYKTGFSRSANEYAAAFLNCGLSSGSADLVVTDRNIQPPLGAPSPLAYTASNSIRFQQGFSTLPNDNFKTLLVPAIAASGDALCALDKPLGYVALPDTTRKNPCQAVQDQANFIAQLLFQNMQDSLIANFDSLYRAKCLGAQSTEKFYATYQPSEYHYTLYYYDQAGNLLKTLPPAAVKPNFDTAYLGQVQAARAAGNDLSNGSNIENMATQYRYNTLNQLVAQKSPDAGISHFWYDRLGRLVVSQNAKQAAGAAAYSYTLYDPLGRITEVGQKPQNTSMTQTISQDATLLNNWLSDLTSGGTKEQITRTVYDLAYPSFGGPAPIAQLNLRNRVSYTQAIDLDNNSSPPYRTASFYSYDIHGNVDTLVQDYGNSSVMGAVSGNRFKLIKYDYDLISGKVNQVSYQPGRADGFYHQYSYDAENRLTGVRTSKDSIQWQNDVSYQYYRHGPLARLELGDPMQQGVIQGLDYAYTLQGWLKSINPSSVSVSGDLYDGDGTTTTTVYAKDAYKLNLHYFDDGTYSDYTPVAPPSGYVQGNALPAGQKKNLYNGNISSMAVSIRKLAQGTAAYAGPLLYNYGYDQLNRITSMDPWAANGSFAPIGTAPMSDFAERYGYDPNGNILTLSRNGTTGNGGQLAMDNLSYHYVYAKSGGGVGEYTPGQAPTTGVDHLTNQLSSIGDAVGSSNYTTDIDNQTAFNYKYDPIGNLIADMQAGITNITWSVYGKILSITNGSGTIVFTYDAAGNRISKTAGGITTWYVRDATGNVMAVYVQGDATRNSGALTQSEIHFYGSSRLGILTSKLNCTTLALPMQTVIARGAKLFELSNHLGNVLATISDRKLQHTTDNSTVDYYTPDVISANDYYSGGMQMPGRSFNSQNLVNGFNGKRYDNEVYGVGNFQDYGMRMYDPRIVRFPSVDPLVKQYPELTPYQFASNTPIQAIDLDGLEKYIVTVRAFIPMAILPNPAPWGSSKVKGDNRNYYAVNSTAYRTEQKVNVNFDNKTVSYSSNRASGSTGLDSKGNETQHSDPSVAGPIPTYDKAALEKGTSTTIYLKANAHDKLIFGSPNINYDLAITIVPKPDGSFDYQIKGIKDGFPAYELWVTDKTNDKSYLLLHTNPKEAGKSPWSLWGSGDEKYNLKSNSSTKTPAIKVNFSDTKNTPESTGDKSVDEKKNLN